MESDSKQGGGGVDGSEENAMTSSTGKWGIRWHGGVLGGGLAVRVLGAAVPGRASRGGGGGD